MQLSRIKIWWRVIKAMILTFSGVTSNILSPEQTVEEINKGKSLIRFGDGEFGIYAGKDIHYQPYSDQLGEAFVLIKKTFERQGEKCKFILAVPQKYMQCSGWTLCKRRVLVSSWAEARLYFKKNFDREKVYGDAFLFQKDNARIYGAIWNNAYNTKTIFFVHNSGEYAREFEKRYQQLVHFIPCKAHDAFSTIDDVQERLLSKIGELEMPAEKVQIIISAGPAGKVLAYRMSMLGYQSIDAGHCWDDPLES